ncbi:MAG: hypothetical protein K0Q83_3153 [Deltaproteobacteria bacterium]|nr:hypothetical protein [Deltaproteobacteria bacterium]
MLRRYSVTSSLLQVRGIVASAFVGFVRANLLIAHRASLDKLGCRGFLRQPDKSTFSRGLGGYEGKLFRYQFFAERSFRHYSYEPASSVPFTFTGKERPP